jgi:hypothetical protein
MINLTLWNEVNTFFHQLFSVNIELFAPKKLNICQNSASFKVNPKLFLPTKVYPDHRGWAKKEGLTLKRYFHKRNGRRNYGE